MRPAAAPWTKEQIAELRRLRNVERLSLLKCSHELGIGYVRVVEKAQELGINERRDAGGPWSMKDRRKEQSS